MNNYYSDKVVLVTGGAGAIGSNLVKNLLGNCRKIIVIDDLSSGHLINVPKSDRVVFINDSILNEKALKKAFSYDVGVVFHLAALFANQNSVDQPRKDLLVNGLGTLKMLEFSKKFDVDRFIFSSSSCVYGSRSGLMHEELPTLRPETPYAATKLLGEKYVNFFNKHHKLKTVTLRYFNSYGPGEFPGKYRNVIPNFLWLAMNKKPLPITGTGNETRDFNYVKNTVDGTLLAGKKDEAIGEIVNIGSGNETRIKDLADKINKLTENGAGLEFIGQRNWDFVKKRRASVEKAKNILGYAPFSDLDLGVNETFNWLKKNSKHVKA